MVLSMERWKGKVAIVTGASAGIGAATVKALVKEGLIVAGFARRIDIMQDLAIYLRGEKGRFHPVKVDLSSEEEILSGFHWVKENLGPVHILINNAALREDTNLTNGDTQLWRNMIEINLLAYVITSREAIKDMKTNKVDGHIININSILGHKVIYNPVTSVYPATKHAITGYTETLRLELTKQGSKIKVTSISPGVTDTHKRVFGDSEESRKAQAFFDALPKLRPEEVADTIILTLSTVPNVQIHEIIVRPIGEPY